MLFGSLLLGSLLLENLQVQNFLLRCSKTRCSKNPLLEYPLLENLLLEKLGTRRPALRKKDETQPTQQTSFFFLRTLICIKIALRSSSSPKLVSKIFITFALNQLYHNFLIKNIWDQSFFFPRINFSDCVFIFGQYVLLIFLKNVFHLLFLCSVKKLFNQKYLYVDRFLH